ncbi:hypothetical protein HU200_033476 [Digitaria exilis]|uniref:Uncharacterized protein n=1 Tax=Digitaria exilis TaxID=1010633 RepID=A0A835BMD6_9POAL|nr:hypothetical protein HU200_033476 [Digitaria exilis]
MVLGLGGCWGGVADEMRVMSPAMKHAAGGDGHPDAKKQQQRVVKEKMKAGEPAKVARAGKERKKRDHQKDPLIVMHQFLFHSRPGLL